MFSRTFAAEDTSEDGTYSIRTNAGMIYVLRAECEGWAATYWMPIELAEDRPTENVDFRRGLVRYVAHTRWAWVGDFFATGDNGECTNPTTGNEQFHRGRIKDLRLGGKATIDGEVTSVTIPMATTATVKGRFVDKEGKPLANRKVEVFYRPEIDRVNWDRDDEIDGRTDASGSFEIRGLIAGIRYQVLLAGTWEWKKGKPTNGTPVAAKSGETVDLGEIVIAGG